MTTAPEAKRRIRDLIAARPALAGIPVLYGKATREAQVAPEMLWLGSIEDGDIDWAAFGRVRQAEEYTIGITAVKETVGDTNTAEYDTEARVAELLTEARKAFQNDPTLNNLFERGRHVRGGQHHHRPHRGTRRLAQHRADPRPLPSPRPRILTDHTTLGGSI
jgi:hypothetical protein